MAGLQALMFPLRLGFGKVGVFKVVIAEAEEERPERYNTPLEQQRRFSRLVWGLKWALRRGTILLGH